MTVKREIILILFLFFAIAFSAAQERVEEKVKVVNVEVPVRVFYKGNPVKNLTIDDFRLYENKKKQTISSLTAVKRKIKSDRQEPRYFVFIFRIYNYNQEFKKGVKYLFENILHEDDKLFVLINNDSMMSYRLKDKEKALSEFEKIIRDQAKLDRGKLTAYLKRIEQEIDMRSFARSIRQGNFLLVQDYLKKYLRIWKEYKKAYLLPDTGRYYHVCRQLENIKKNKWVINFYQMEMIPNIILSGELKKSLNRFTDNLMESPGAEHVSYGRILRTRLNEVEKETNIIHDYPVEEIGRLFYKVDSSFHTIFCRTTIGVESRDHESMKISADMEKCLSNIAAFAGGMLVSTNALKTAVEKIVDHEDLYYLITYAPKNPEKPGTLKIKTQKKYRVVYDEHMRSDYINDYLKEREKEKTLLPAISISELDIRDKKLIVSIDKYLLKKTGTGTTGQVQVRIRVESEDGKIIFDQSKPLTTENKTISISIPFNNLKKGEYAFVVMVQDRFTGKTDNRRIEKKVK